MPASCTASQAQKQRLQAARHAEQVVCSSVRPERPILRESTLKRSAAEAVALKSGRGRRLSDSPLNSVPSFSRKPPWEVRRSLSEGSDLGGKVGGRVVCLVYVMRLLVLVFVCEHFVRTECLILLLMFVSFTATLHFICIFTNVSSCSPLLSMSD